MIALYVCLWVGNFWKKIQKNKPVSKIDNMLGTISAVTTEGVTAELFEV